MALDMLIIGLIAVVLILVLIVIMYYNKFVSLNNLAQEDWKQIEPLLQQRLDTIPNLVATAKGVMKQEKDLFEGISKARESALSASNMGDKLKANAKVGALIGNFIARSEAYPEMKSNANMQMLMEQITGIEEKLKYGRQRYQSTVREYIDACTLFPGSFFASGFGFRADKWPYFEADEAAKKAPNVGELLKN